MALRGYQVAVAEMEVDCGVFPKVSSVARTCLPRSSRPMLTEEAAYISPGTQQYKLTTAG